jgi:hypothetical protein
LKPRSIPPKPVVEYETVSLRLPTTLLRTLDRYARFLGSGSDRAYIVAKSLELALDVDADFQKTLRDERRTGVPEPAEKP